MGSQDARRWVPDSLGFAEHRRPRAAYWRAWDARITSYRQIQIGVLEFRAVGLEFIGFSQAIAQVLQRFTERLGVVSKKMLWIPKI